MANGDTAAQPAKTKKAAAKPVLDVELSISKSTKGTHVLSEDELGLNLYFSKLLFRDVEDAANKKYRLTLTEVQ